MNASMLTVFVRRAERIDTIVATKPQTLHYQLIS